MLHKVSIHTNPRERLEDIHNRSNGIDSESVQRIHLNLTRKWKQRIQALNTIAAHYGRHLFVANKLEQGFSAAAASFKSGGGLMTLQFPQYVLKKAKHQPV